MSSVPNPSSPLNPSHPEQSTGPVKPGTDKFKDLMKIDSSAEKQKKKKKRSTESEEENKAQLRAGPAQIERPLTETTKTGKYPKIQKIGESEKKQTKHQKRSEETHTDLAHEEAEALAQKKQPQPLETSKPADQLQDHKDVSISIESSIQNLKELDKTIEEETTLAFKEETKENFKDISLHKEKTTKESIQQPTAAAAPTTLAPSFLSPPTTTAPAYSLLTPDMLALFEKMVSVISILKDSGISETTIHLNTPEFENSQFYGAQIVIREYSTAPLAYNVELLGNPLAADLFKTNLPNLRSSLSDPKYRFRIHRLESSISQEPHDRVERKEKS